MLLTLFMMSPPSLLIICFCVILYELQHELGNALMVFYHVMEHWHIYGMIWYWEGSRLTDWHVVRRLLVATVVTETLALFWWLVDLKECNIRCPQVGCCTWRIGSVFWRHQVMLAWVRYTLLLMTVCQLYQLVRG